MAVYQKSILTLSTIFAISLAFFGRAGGDIGQ
jgi:hypothetical protein